MKFNRLFILLFALCSVTAYAGGQADIIYHGGTVLTMNDAQPRA